MTTETKLIHVLQINKQFGDDLCGWITAASYDEYPSYDEVESQFIAVNQGVKKSATLETDHDYRFVTINHHLGYK